MYIILRRFVDNKITVIHHNVLAVKTRKYWKWDYDKLI